MTSSIPPAFIFFAGALLVALAPARSRQFLMLGVPLLGGLNLWGLWSTAEGLDVGIFDTQLEFLRVDKLSLLFGLLFHIAAFVGAVFALHVRDRLQQTSALLYAGAALGAVFAGDLISLFIFWEAATVGSVFLILARRTPQATQAGMRYLMLQLVSGLLLLGGVVILIGDTGSVAFEHIGIGSLGGILVFVAFGIKCGFPLMHSWITDAYPESTPTGTVFLSAFTTKVAVYALARGYAGTEVLIYIGTAMTAFTIFYAVIENDLRRVLSYSMINQIGFMVVGIGIGSDLALNGAVSHTFSHVLYKGLLFMSMGAVLHQTGKINGSELGGLYKSMPQTTTLCIIGAASISAFPLFSGFVSKSMVITAAAEEGHWIVWILLLFASAGVFHHAGIKIPYFAFFAHDSGIRTREAPLNMRIAMTISAILCVVIGCYPAWLYSLLPYPVDYEPYTGSHVLAQIQLLFFSALAFIWLKLQGLYPPELPSVNLDIDWVYRRLIPRIARYVERAIAEIAARVREWFIHGMDDVLWLITHQHKPDGALARAWPTGINALWILLLLGVCLAIYYV
jgi:multicomponent Na+:H+ antiporter subunit D